MAHDVESTLEKCRRAASPHGLTATGKTILKAIPAEYGPPVEAAWDKAPEPGAVVKLGPRSAGVVLRTWDEEMRGDHEGSLCAHEMWGLGDHVDVCVELALVEEKTPAGAIRVDWDAEEEPGPEDRDEEAGWHPYYGEM